MDAPPLFVLRVKAPPLRLPTLRLPRLNAPPLRLPTLRLPRAERAADEAPDPQAAEGERAAAEARRMSIVTSKLPSVNLTSKLPHLTAGHVAAAGAALVAAAGATAIAATLDGGDGARRRSEHQLG